MSYPSILQKTQFYLLMLPGDKPFITKEFSKRTNSNVKFFSSKEKLENGFIVDNKTIKKQNKNDGKIKLKDMNNNLNNIEKDVSYEYLSPSDKQIITQIKTETKKIETGINKLPRFQEETPTFNQTQDHREI